MLVSYRWFAPVFRAVLLWHTPIRSLFRSRRNQSDLTHSHSGCSEGVQLRRASHGAERPANLTSVPGAAPVQPQYAGKAVTNRPTKELNDILTRTDVALTATAIEAVRVSEKWRTENTLPRLDQTVVFCTALVQASRP